MRNSPSSAVCLGSHRVGISDQHAGIPSDLRTCVTGGGALRCKSPLISPCLFSDTNLFSQRQRSVTSARRTRATRRAPCAAWTVGLPSRASANPGGRANAARTVSSVTQNTQHRAAPPARISAKMADARCHVTAQTSTSVWIPNFRPDATKNATTFLAVSSASVKVAISPLTGSPVWVRLH